MMAATASVPVPHQGGSAPLSLMSCVRESSPPLHDFDSSTEMDLDKNEPSKKRRFHPFRGLRKMFRRKVRHSGGDDGTSGVEPATPESVTTPSMDAHRSRSTSELLAGDESTRRKSGCSGGLLYGASAGGLSVSHDSVFTGEPQSGSDMELDTAQSSSSLSIQQLVIPGVRAELIDAVRRRRGRGDTSDDEDLGLPRSPCNSPTTADILLEKSVKEHTTKSHSTCSDGSLLSMGSSEMDEDSYGLHSGHSSKISLHDKKYTSTGGVDTESELDLGDSGTVSAPLSHSAAKHKMSIRPKRTHGAPRRSRRVPQLTTGTSLPTTPEVNEDISARSVTPELSKQDLPIVELSTSADSASKGMLLSNSVIPSETRLKSASLPPGLALSGAIASAQLSRSRSNAATAEVSSFPRSSSHDNELGIRSHKGFSTLGEEEEDEKINEKKKEESFFGRLLSRRSGKKKKERVEDNDIFTSSVHKQKESVFNAMYIKKRIDEKGRYSNESKYECSSNSVSTGNIVYKSQKSGPAARQRVEPIELPPSPDLSHNNDMSTLKVPINLLPLKLESSQNFPPTGLSHNICESSETYILLEENKSSNIVIKNNNESFFDINSTNITLSESQPLKISQKCTPEIISIACENSVTNEQSHVTTSSIKHIDNAINFDNSFPKMEVQIRNLPSQNLMDQANVIKTLSPPLELQRLKRMDAYSSTGEIIASQENLTEKCELLNKQFETVHPRQRRPDINIENIPAPPVVAPSYQENNITVQHNYSGIGRMQTKYNTHSTPIINEKLILPEKVFDNTYKIQQAKSRVTISGLSSYQQKISQFSTESNTEKTDHGFISLNHISSVPPLPTLCSVSKSQSFKYKSANTEHYNEMASLPYSINSYNSNKEISNLSDIVDDTKKLISSEIEHGHTTNCNESSHKKDNQSFERINPNGIQLSDPVKRSCSVESIKSVTTILPTESENLSNEVTKVSNIENNSKLSMKNVNTSIVFTTNPTTPSNNHVIVTVANPETSKTQTQADEIIADPQISITRLQFKQRTPQNEKPTVPQVPEFLKIQLNRVDTKPTTNIITSINMTEDVKNTSDTDIEKSNGAVICDDSNTKRKFSKDDVEIIDKTCNASNKNEIKEITKGSISDMPMKKLSTETLITNESVKKNIIENNKNSTLSSSFKLTTIETCCTSTLSQIKKNDVDLIKPKIADEHIKNSVNGNISPRSLNLISNVCQSSAMIEKPYLKKKSSSLEIIEHKKDTVKKQLSDSENVDKINNIKDSKSDEQKIIIDDTIVNVTLRKKSVPLLKTDEEPELMKVFARRSLKLNGDSEILGQQVLVMLENTDKTNDNQNVAKSRDSDKENETNSPQEERKKMLTSPNIKDIPKAKEILSESKKTHTETTEFTLKTSAINNVRLGFCGNKVQRPITGSTNIIEKIENKEIEKTKTILETKSEKNTNNLWINAKKEREINITNSVETINNKNNCNKIEENKDNINDIENETFIPLFKKIQQRKEEWEQRAQQAMKKATP